jgi:energy-coupling factor transporter ATP-binding protein EcfA2
VAELNSLDDVLALCESATPETLETTVRESLQALVELGLVTRADLGRVFITLTETAHATAPSLSKAVFPVVSDLGLTETETAEVWAALKTATGATVGNLKKDFSTYLRVNDLVAEQPSTATVLVKLALESGLEMWHDPEGNPWATLRTADHIEHHRLKTKSIRRYLAHRYYEEHHSAPNSQAVQDALMTLEAKAVFDGPEHEVYTRLAEVDGVIYLDLANDRWQVVRVTPDGWAVVDADAVPVRFRRPRGMLPLPIPRTGGSLEPLAELLNVDKDSRDLKLIVAWLLQGLRGTGPYPVLVLTGGQGSGKSTAAKMLRALLDPNVSPLRSLSKDERDLFIAAVNGWALAFDNISGLSQWTSDALCKLSTGGGLSTRELFSDDDETLLDALRPVVLNGITDFVDKQDLVSRALQVHLPAIPEENRKSEAAIWERFDDAQPGILGALLDVVVQGLQRLPTTKLETLPRLADFALWATACEKPLGWQPGAFTVAYQGAQDDLIRDALDAEPVAVALMKLPEQGDGLAVKWEFTATGLLDELNKIEGHKDGKRPPKGWPGAAHILSGTLKRIAPALLEQGLEVKQDRDNDAKRSKKWAIRVNRENKRPKRPGASDDTRNTVQDDTNAPDASPDASQPSDASSVRGGKQASGEKHRAGRKADASDASDASKPITSNETPAAKWTEEI